MPPKDLLSPDAFSGSREQDRFADFQFLHMIRVAWMRFPMLGYEARFRDRIRAAHVLYQFGAPAVVVTATMCAATINGNQADFTEWEQKHVWPLVVVLAYVTSDPSVVEDVLWVNLPRYEIELTDRLWNQATLVCLAMLIVELMTRSVIIDSRLKAIEALHMRLMNNWRGDDELSKLNGRVLQTEIRRLSNERWQKLRGSDESYVLGT